MQLRFARALSRSAIVATLAMALTPLGTPAFAAASTSAGSSPTVDLGVIDRAGTATPTAAQRSPAASPGAASRAAQLRAKGARFRSRTAQAALARSSTSASATNISGSRDSQGRLVTAFNGVSSLDSAVTNFGAEFEPPDQGLCAGNGFVLEPVNSAYTIYRRDGSVVTGPFNVNVIFQRGLTQFTSDPRCVYDQATNTWFAIILFIANNNKSSTIDIAVNPSGDPTTAWTVYSVDTSDHGGPLCPCFGDQPRIGIDAYNIYLSSDEFPIVSPVGYNGPQLYAIAKSDLVQLRAHARIVHFGNITIEGSNQFVGIEPAITTGASDAEYFLSNIDLSGKGDTNIAVFAMTNRQAVAAGKAPTLSSLVIPSEFYVTPPQSIQKGSTGLLDSGDDRMQQTQFVNGTIWGELATAVTPVGDTNARAGIAWFNVHAALANGQLGSAHIARQGYLAVNGEYLMYPAIQASPNGDAAMVMTQVSANRFASAAFATMPRGANTFGRIQIAAAGNGPYNADPNFSTRWGDYSWAQFDPQTGTFWLATEYMPPLSSQTPDGINNWGTEVLNVQVGGEG